MIQESDLPDEVKKDSIAIFFTLAEAEGEIHSKKPEEVNFHEVGATDSIIDIVGSVLAFRQLNVQGVLLSPIPTGSGQVECAHGVYPIPAPATASLLRKFRLPVSLDGEECEMLTPTGAVLLGFWRANYPVIGPLSDGVMIKTGHSLGHQEMKNRPNLLRVTLWETSTESETLGENDQKSEELIEMEANLDDVSGEILGAAVTELFRLGALDVWLTPILMKKGRPGHLLGVLVPPSKRQETLTAIFRLTGTFGVRESRVLRHALARRWETVETKSGPIRIKIGSFDGTDLHFAPEFDDASAASMKTGRPLPEIYREALAVFQRKNAKEVVDE